MNEPGDATAPVPTPVSPAVEARFRALAGAVSDADWQRLVAATTDAAMRRLATCGAFDGAAPEALETAYKLLGQLIVDHTNVALTSVAAATEPSP